VKFSQNKKNFDLKKWFFPSLFAIPFGIYLFIIILSFETPALNFTVQVVYWLIPLSFILFIIWSLVNFSNFLSLFLGILFGWLSYLINTDEFWRKALIFQWKENWKLMIIIILLNLILLMIIVRSKTIVLEASSTLFRLKKTVEKIFYLLAVGFSFSMSIGLILVFVSITGRVRASDYFGSPSYIKYFSEIHSKEAPELKTVLGKYTRNLNTNRNLDFHKGSKKNIEDLSENAEEKIYKFLNDYKSIFLKIRVSFVGSLTALLMGLFSAGLVGSVEKE